MEIKIRFFGDLDLPSEFKNRACFAAKAEIQKPVVANYKVIDLFYSGPAGLAIEIGRSIQKNGTGMVF